MFPRLFELSLYRKIDCPLVYYKGHHFIAGRDALKYS